MSLKSTKDEVFFIDGSLRDILISKTKMCDWELFLSYSVQNADEVRISIDSEIKAYDELSATELFRLGNQYAVALSIIISGVILNTHFFDEDEIEIDLAPKEVTSDDQIEHLEKFLIGLASLLDKQINIYGENSYVNSLYQISV